MPMTRHYRDVISFSESLASTKRGLPQGYGGMTTAWDIQEGALSLWNSVPNGSYICSFGWRRVENPSLVSIHLADSSIEIDFKYNI